MLDLGQGVGAVRARGRVVGAEQHVVEHGEEGKQAPALQHVRQAFPRGAVGGQAVDALAEEGDASRAGRDERPEIEFIRVDLPAPFGPRTATISPSPTCIAACHSTWKSP